MLYLQNRKYSYNTSPYLQVHLEKIQCLYQQQWLAGWKGRFLSQPSWTQSRHWKAAALPASVSVFPTAVRARTHHLGTLCSSCCHSCSFCGSCKEAHCTPSGKERNPSEVRLLKHENFMFHSLVCAVIPVLAEMPSSCFL